MANFTWYNLPKQIKELIAPYSEFLTNNVKNITWYNLPKKLDALYTELYALKECSDIDPKTFTWYNLPNKLEALKQLVECENYNFDVTATDFADMTIEYFKENYLTEGEGLKVIDYKKQGNRIQARFLFNSITNFTSLDGLDFTDVKKITIDGLELLTFNNAFNLKSVDDAIFSKTIKTLVFQNCGLEGFNPKQLPDALEYLALPGNKLTYFNPDITLPVTLTTLDFNGNLIDDAGYTISESWANAQPAFTNECTISFSGNTDSVTGTNLETILLTKNSTIIA